MTKTEFSSHLTLAVKAALEAGSCIETIRKIGFKTQLKSDCSPVTSADTASDRCIRNYLKNTPEPVISEEHPIAKYEIRRHWTRLWLVDPLDGTKEFIQGTADYSVNIALIENTRPVLGVLYFPAQRSLYFAEASMGAFKHCFTEFENPLDFLLPKASKLKKNPFSEPYSVACSRSCFGTAEADYINALSNTWGTVKKIEAGGSLKQALVAEGAVHEYPRFGKTMEWDTAAGQCIIEQSGGSVVNYENGRPLSYNSEFLVNPFFIARR